jgi:hypothetical protein
MDALPRELALRIALATRVLPGMTISKLIEILHDRIGSPLDDERLKTITVTNLKTGLGSLDGEEDGEDIGIGLANIKLAVRYYGVMKKAIKTYHKCKAIKKVTYPTLFVLPSAQIAVR